MANKGQREEALLDLGRLLSLPDSIIARVCRFLRWVDVLSLARSCRTLKILLIDWRSKPFWDAARYLLGMPSWRGVSPPRAAAFFYDKKCQAVGCNEWARLEALSICRRYCWGCALKNLMTSEEIKEKFPSLPLSLLGRLAWTNRRTKDVPPRSHARRYYLKGDLEALWSFVRTRPYSTPSSVAALHEILLPLYKDRKRTTAEVQTWWNRELRRRKQTRSERWTKISSGLQTRFGWRPVPYCQASPDLRLIMNELFAVPELNEQVWRSIGNDIEFFLKREAKSWCINPRPYALKSEKYTFTIESVLE